MEEDLDELYPPNGEQIIAVTGSVTSGFQHWGPFPSMKEAVTWVESKQPFIGYTSIVYVKKPEDYPIKIAKD